jgi:ketosteroid isomerase-like protein
MTIYYSHVNAMPIGSSSASRKWVGSQIGHRFNLGSAVTTWHYKVDGRGPQKVAEGVLMPLMKEWREFKLVPTDFITEGDTVVSLGRFTGTHSATGKVADAGYVWNVTNGWITRFRQFIDTVAVEEARK